MHFNKLYIYIYIDIIIVHSISQTLLSIVDILIYFNFVIDQETIAPFWIYHIHRNFNMFYDEIAQIDICIYTSIYYTFDI